MKVFICLEFVFLIIIECISSALLKQFSVLHQSAHHRSRQYLPGDLYLGVYERERESDKQEIYNLPYMCKFSDSSLMCLQSSWGQVGSFIFNFLVGLYLRGGGGGGGGGKGSFSPISSNFLPPTSNFFLNLFVISVTNKTM